MFEPGYVPKGWVRGERLTMQAPSRFSGGFIPGYFWRKRKDEKDVNATYQVGFMEFDLSEVKSWLSWWAANESAETKKYFEGLARKLK